MSAPKIIYITPAPEGGFVEFWAEHPSAARGDVAYIPQKGATKMQAEIDALKAEIAALKAPLKVLSAEEVTEPGFYWSSCGAKSNHWVPVWVLRDRPNSLYYAFPGSAADYSLKGLKFIGPIQTPEV